jgi:hypothetical protein
MQPTIHPVELKERQWHRDMASYRELRRQGYQPKNIDGCAELEGRVSSQFELETGHLFTKEQMVEVREGIRIAHEIEETGSSDGVHRELP